jgi:hypothetical protein
MIEGVSSPPKSCGNLTKLPPQREREIFVDEKVGKGFDM